MEQRASEKVGASARRESLKIRSVMRRTASAVPLVSRSIAQAASAVCERIYAIGDVHGRLDLFERLLKEIQEDGKLRGSRPTKIILLGDLIDRGPSSRQLIELVRRFQHSSNAVIALRGNHEEMLLKSAEGSGIMQRVWLRNDGSATLLSFGLDPSKLSELSACERGAEISAAIGEETLTWLKGLPLSFRSGGYFFCHAGVRPGLALAKQTTEDLLWIREDFLWSHWDHGAVIVHGHSETARVEITANRINVDTGAYRTGVLTAVGLEGASKWFISTSNAALDLSMIAGALEQTPRAVCK